MPGTSANETPLTATGLPLSVRVTAPAVGLLVLIGTLNVTSTVETGVVRGLGETAAIAVTVRGWAMTSVIVPLALL